MIANKPENQQIDNNTPAETSKPVSVQEASQGSLDKLKSEERVKEIKALQEMASEIPSDYKNENGEPKVPTNWERIFAKFFMITHPGFALKKLLNNGKLPNLSKNSSSELIMAHKHQTVLDAQKYHSKKQELFPSPVAA